MRAARPSATARLIAQCLLRAAREPELAPLLAPGSAALLERQLRAAGGPGPVETLLRRAWARALRRGLENLILPGLTPHYLTRKRWLETRARAALAAGARQMMVLGAGLDTLAWRLAEEFSGAQFLELDHPATQAAKRAALGETANFHLLAADFTQTTPPARLPAAEYYARDAPAIFIAEGLLMYFPAVHAAALLRGLAEAAAPGSRLLFTYLRRGSLERRPHVRLWLRLRGEPFAWAIAPGALPELLRNCGWRLVAEADDAALRAGVLAPAGLAHLPLVTGEHLAEAVRADA